MSNLHQRPIHIILVEDNEDDVLLTKRAFAKSKVQNHIYVAMTADAALHMARREGEFCALPIIDLILLDINLSEKSGLELLRKLKTDAALEDIPVIALSGQASEETLEKIYRFQGSSFISKPANMKEFDEIVQVVEMCWFRAINRMRRKKDLENLEKYMAFIRKKACPNLDES